MPVIDERKLICPEIAHVWSKLFSSHAYRFMQRSIRFDEDCGVIVASGAVLCDPVLVVDDSMAGGEYDLIKRA